MLDLFAKHDEFKNRNLVITDAGERVTYGEFHGYSEKLSVHMSEGDLIFILCRNTLGSLLGYLTCLKYHIVPVMLEGNMAVENVQKLMREYQPKFLLMPKERVEEFAIVTKADFFDYSLVENQNLQGEPSKLATDKRRASGDGTTHELYLWVIDYS